jgi:hypothetical protein
MAKAREEISRSVLVCVIERSLESRSLNSKLNAAICIWGEKAEA